MFGKNNTLMMGKVFIFSRTTVFDVCAILTGATSVQPGVSSLSKMELRRSDFFPRQL